MTEEYKWYGRFLTESEIVTDLIDNRLSTEDRAEFRRTAESDLIMFHHGLGMWIRNFYGLWREDNPYSRINAAPNAQGVIDDELFPDQISQRIIETAWRKLRID